MPESATSVKLKPVIEFAREEAERRGDRRIGTDHLLLALLHDETSAPARALGVTLAEGRSALEELDLAALASVGIHLDGTLPAVSPRGRRWITLNSSARAAVGGAKQAADRERKGRRIEGRHLLLALLAGREPDPAVALLLALSLEAGKVRERLAAA
jgi:ATP-dependent Clp protease ATP-binding subunit ClpA